MFADAQNVHNNQINAVNGFITRRVDLLVIAGEHSGDEHAARITRDLLTRRPGLAVAAFEQGLVERPKKAVVQRICAVRAEAGSVRIDA